MFFELNMLCRDKGQFTVVWLAATRGIKKVSRKQIEDVDTKVVCNEIWQMITSTSNRPKLRLSLRLAARLICGVVMIHRQQVIIFQAMLFEFYQQIQRPQTPFPEKKPAAKVRPKKKTRPVTSQDVAVLFGGSQGGVEADLAVTQITEEALADALMRIPRAQVDAISLREELPRQQTTEDLGSFADEMDPLGRLVPAKLITGPLDSFMFKEPTLPLPLGQVSLQPDTDKTIQPPMEKPIPPPHHEEAVLPSPMEIAEPARPDEGRGTKRAAESPHSLEPPAKALRVDESPQRNVIPDEDATILAPPKERARRKQLKIFENLSAPGKALRHGRLRASHIDEELFDATTLPRIIRPITCEMILDEDVITYLDPIRRTIPGSLGAIPRDAHASISGRATPRMSAQGVLSDMATPILDPKDIRVSSAHQPLEMSSRTRVTPGDTRGSVTSLLQGPELPICEPEIQTAATLPTEKTLAVPIGEDIPAGLDIPIHSTPRIQRRDDHRSPIKKGKELPTAIAQRPFNNQARLSGILLMIKNWDFGAKELTIDDVAQKPLIRRNIAEALSDLSVLASKNYILLHHRENSIALRNIEKGPKMGAT